MLPFLEALKGEDLDHMSFLPGKEEGSIDVSAGTYHERGEPITGNMGNFYHINIFKESRDSNVYFDTFEAVLSDPLIYMSHIIPSGFFGFISKKTTTSDEFNNDIVASLKKSLS